MVHILSGKKNRVLWRGNFQNSWNFIFFIFDHVSCIFLGDKKDITVYFSQRMTFYLSLDKVR